MASDEFEQLDAGRKGALEPGETPGERSAEECLREVEELRKLVEEKNRQAEEYLNRLKYLQAEFINYQNKAKKDLEEAMSLGAERVIVKLLGVIDNLERAVEAAKTSRATETLLQGVELILRELKDALGSEGLKEIESVGKPFNPSLHEAVATVEDTNFADNTVVEELRKGYTVNNRVVRPSMVKVSRKPSDISR